MEDRAGWIRPLLIVFLLAAPAVMQRIASHFIDDPYLQPLALTVEELATSGEKTGDSTWINVQVGWGQAYDGAMTQDGLRRMITRALANRTERFFVVVRDQPGARVDVTFIVGSNRYGPYPPAGMAGGMNTALMALKMATAANPGLTH